MAIKIYVDQGHNPRSPNTGAAANGLTEADITYRVGQALAALLRADPAYEVRVSRPTADTQLGTTNAGSLRVRVDDANSWGADAFISIHTNSADNPAANGTESLVYAANTPAYRLGEDIALGISEATGIRNRGVVLRPGLYVLRKTAMPAVLTEIGFISNPDEARLMNENPGLFARGIYNGIRRFYAR